MGTISIALMVLCLSGDLQVNITDYGAKGDEKTNSSPAFYKAYAALKNKMLAKDRDLEGTIFVPSAQLSYIINDPIIIQDNNIKIKGEGKGSRLLNTGFGPSFILGIRSTEKTSTRLAALDPRYTPPKKLAIGGNARRLCGDSSLAFHGGSFDLGPMNPDGSFSRWEGVKLLTVDLAIEDHEAEWRQHGIFTLGGYNSTLVFSLNKGGVPNQYDFRFTDKSGNLGSFSFIGEPKFNRVSFQLNLETKSLDVWVNRLKQPIKLNYSGSGGLKKNDFDPFLVGCDQNVSDGRVPLANLVKMPDITIHALTLGTNYKYADNPVLSKMDGTPADDPYEFGLDNQCVAQLYGADATPSNRLVSAFSGKNRYRIFYGYALQTDQLSLLGGQSGNSFENIQIVHLNPVSPIIHTLGVLDLDIRGVSFKGGSQNLSAIPATASYYTRINSSDFNSTDYSIVGSWSIIRANDVRFRHVGRGAILTQASDIRFNDSFVAFTSPYTDTIASMFGGLYGGKYSFTDLDIDMEGAVCNIAPFYVEQSPTISTLLDLKRIYLGTSARGIPIVVSKKAIGGDAWPYKINLIDVDTIAGQPSVDIQEAATRLP